MLDLGCLGVICIRLEINQIKQKHKTNMANFSVENIHSCHLSSTTTLYQPSSVANCPVSVFSSLHVCQSQSHCQSSDCVFDHPSRLLAEKCSDMEEQVSKLRNGLFKVSDTQEKVEAMSVELEEAKKQVAEFQSQCDKFLAVIIQQTHEADKQQRVSTTNTLSCTQITKM